MDEQFDYYLDSKIFRPGERVFINKVVLEFPTGLHAHDFIEIAYVASGIGRHQIGEREYPAAGGSLYIINRNIPHKFIPINGSRNKITIFNCIFTPEFIDLSLLNCKDFTDVVCYFLFNTILGENDELLPALNLPEIESGIIADLYTKMLNEYERHEQGYTALVRAYIIELLITVFRHLGNINPDMRAIVNTGKKLIVEKVLGYIRANYSREIKLEELAMLAFLSPSHFCRQFKAFTGMTVSEYTQKVRIEQACTLLKNTDLKVIEIASKVGYSDINYFNEVFKRITTLTPRQFRNTL